MENIALVITDTRMIYPMAVFVLLTFIAGARLFRMRVTAVRDRQISLGYYRAFQGDSEPEHVAIAARHYLNLFETPTLFFAACLTVLAAGLTDTLFVTIAWLYLASRVAQSAIHLTYNNVLHRARAFLATWVMLLVFWGRIVFVISTG